MAKFNENELTEKLKEYENKGNIRLKLERGLDGKIELEDATVIYDEKTGFIKKKKPRKPFLAAGFFMVRPVRFERMTFRVGV